MTSSAMGPLIVLSLCFKVLVKFFSVILRTSLFCTSRRFKDKRTEPIKAEVANVIDAMSDESDGCEEAL